MMRLTLMTIQGRLLAAMLAVAAACPTAQAAVVGFEDVGADLGSESYWNGKDRYDSTGEQDAAFSSGALTFTNHYHYDDTYDYAYWDGFAYSNLTNTAVRGLDGQYNAIAGSGADDSLTYAADDSLTYAIGYSGFYLRNPTITIPDSMSIESIAVTNTNYVYYAITEPDPYGFATPFKTGDWFLLTITGKNAADTAVGDVGVYLADYRSLDGAVPYALDEWTTVDLSSLAGSKTLEFTLTGSDVDPIWGLNTPTYFAIDNITVSESTVPEPSSLVLMLAGSIMAGGLWACRRFRRHAA